MVNDMHAVDIAVLKVELNGLREQQKSHAVDTRDRFDTIEERFDSLIEQLETISAAFNKGKGIAAVILVLGGMLGASFFKGAGALLGLIK